MKKSHTSTHISKTRINKMSPEEECLFRNIFAMMDTDIPSYALWRTSDIAKRTIEERIQWWKVIEPKNTDEVEFVHEAIRTLEHYRHVFMNGRSQ